jgi:hypothetical protein
MREGQLLNVPSGRVKRLMNDNVQQTGYFQPPITSTFSGHLINICPSSDLFYLFCFLLENRIQCFGDVLEGVKAEHRLERGSHTAILYGAIRNAVRPGSCCVDSRGHIQMDTDSQIKVLEFISIEVHMFFKLFVCVRCEVFTAVRMSVSCCCSEVRCHVGW